MTRWNDLKQRHDAVQGRHILELFDTDRRPVEFCASFGELLFDYSKTNIDQETKDQLVSLAEEMQVAARRDAMFSGAKINETEGRAVLHTALRNMDRPLIIDGADAMCAVRETYQHMQDFARKLRGGQILGQGGKITDVVNIGIGGSDLGPA
ncbi:MAG: glucose-6-phosphate isomerase, partial [Albidovulum sp.]